MFLRPVRLDRLDRAAVLCTAAPARGADGGRFRCADGPQGVARAEAEAGRGLQNQDARRLVQDHGRYRHLLRAGPDHERGAESSAHGGAKHFCRAPWRDAARTGAALFAHAVSDPRSGDGGYCGSRERVEGREVTPLSSLRGAKRRSNPAFALPLYGLLRFARNDGEIGGQSEACPPSSSSFQVSRWARRKSAFAHPTNPLTPRPPSAHRGESDLPRSIRTGP